MKNIALIVVVLVVLGGGYYYMNQSTPVEQPVTQEVPVTEVVAEIEPNQTFEVKGLNYSYDVKEIVVKKGDVVRIDFTNTEGMHDFKIDELNVATKVIKAGESESVTFTASQVGNFEYYCSVGQHRANGMFGKLVVEE